MVIDIKIIKLNQLISAARMWDKIKRTFGLLNH